MRITAEKKYADHATQLQEAGKAATHNDAILLFDQAWSHAFTASRHALLATRNEEAAQAARSAAAVALSQRRKSAADTQSAQAARYTEFAKRHREAAESAATKAAGMEQEAVAKAKEVAPESAPSSQSQSGLRRRRDPDAPSAPT